ncbi:fasciclin domain-containing protein [Carboxylicivirga marina]|uniref:Fasciclin domain-containing protein n=1 Tax=Carboxylicivirga marina TaxID=2800988 RepID=A0ABS1HJP0_9BACT|nr:fasciclin domain-containing protein [Carboxylicivirga marina]MBK3517801.1 fasciclin domain-containing protein [Carboxylicivirga marina]
MRKIYGIIETGFLLLVGVFTLWLSLSEKYALLMNENFRWLTFAGSILILIIGITSLFKSPKSNIVNILFFGVLLLVVLIGKPYVPNESTINPSEHFMQAGLWDQIDQSRFPKEELRTLSTTEADKVYNKGRSFTTVGVVKRLDELDGHGSFALMSTFMYCCVADMFGTGFRVPSEKFADLEDGQMVMISGELINEEMPIELPNFRFGRAMISSINQNYYLKAENIMTYNRLDQLPLLSELISKGERIQLFNAALEKTGLIEELAGSESFTLFIPVDKAIENLETPLDQLSVRNLKKFLKAHIVEGKLFSKDLKEFDQLETISGKDISISFKPARHKVNESRVLFEDTEAQNGVIHYIYPALTESN